MAGRQHPGRYRPAGRRGLRGETDGRGAVADQATLRGLLGKLWDLNLTVHRQGGT